MLVVLTAGTHFLSVTEMTWGQKGASWSRCHRAELAPQARGGLRRKWAVGQNVQLLEMGVQASLGTKTSQKTDIETSYALSL